MARVVVRYSEFERYDIQRDAEVVRFMATTDGGSYWAEVPSANYAAVRRDRAAFKERVTEFIQAGVYPKEVALG